MTETPPLYAGDIENRLVRFLLTEQRTSRRATLLLHELPVDERVAKGMCMTDLAPLDAHGRALRFRFPLQACKLREGDWMVLNRGKPVGPEIGTGVQVVVGRVDPLARTVTLEVLGSGEVALRGDVWTLDYVSSDTTTPRLAAAVRDASADDHHLLSLLLGEQTDDTATAQAPPPGLDLSQERAATEALSHRLTLIHGPPGTGKTLVLAAVVKALASRGQSVLITAFTHRAIDNVLQAVMAADPKTPVVKLGRRSADLDPAIPCTQPHRLGFSRRVAVIGSTVFALTRLPREKRFDVVIIDEAGQLPLAHAAVALARGRESAVLAGDHRQLPPVFSATHLDTTAASSVFGHLAALYPHRMFMLQKSYRLPPGLCRFPSEAFYGAQLQSNMSEDPAIGTASKELRQPEFGPLWRIKGPMRALWVNHQGYGPVSPPEAEAVARLVTALVVDQGIEPAEIAVVAPHRAQVREITDRLWRHLGPDAAAPIVVDTVERMQGQERNVIVLSLTVSDGWFMADEIDFILSTNRLNVSITRARKLLLVVGSREFFRICPASPEYLEAAWLFRRLEEALVPASVDLTAEAHAWVGVPEPQPL
ncbi:AAA family ATPase [Candidatus Fermentibacteria bacterium]|nr:AAA family ATPase [Candidatus Fermentibacteria bacterium]